MSGKDGQKLKVNFLRSAAVLIVLLCLLCAGCVKSAQPYKETQVLLDTVIEITAYGPEAEAAVRDAMEEFRKIEPLTNHFAAGSQVSQINRQAGIAKVKVEPQLLELILHAKDMSERMDGAFDVSVGALTQLWGVGHKGDYVPTAPEIKAALPLVDYRQIEVDEKENTVWLPQRGMYLDLGGVAKGAALSNAAAALQKRKITGALVNAGGDVRVIGKKPDGKPWRIGVQDPRNSEAVLAKLTMENWDTLETSGDYQRYFIKDGVRYHHILDPKTGTQPREIASVTLIYKDSKQNENLTSSGILVLGVTKGLEVLKRFPGVEALIVTGDGRVITTPGLEGQVELNQAAR